MLPVAYHIVSNPNGTVTGPDPLDLGLLVVLLIGISYLTYELVERKTTTRRRLSLPLSIVTVALIGLTISFAILPSINSVPRSPQTSIVIIPSGAGVQTSTNGFFVRSVITVLIGVNNTVGWQNSDSVVHSAHSDLGLFFSGDIPAGFTNYFTFTTVGNYTYHCNQHAWMAGTIIVKR